MSTCFASNSEALLKSHILNWCGFKSSSCIILCKCDLLILVSSANSLTIHRALSDSWLHVAFITFSRSLWPYLHGFPGYGKSLSPSIPCFTNLVLQCETATVESTTLLVISLLLNPSAASITTLIRYTNLCCVVGLMLSLNNLSCSTLRTILAGGRAIHLLQNKD